ncbi:MAG: hypothetical protein H7A08_03825 [Oceanospirillaceae bacterium]|nr:hypothetical protein [Oceanospirillaceae bacterium]
MKLVAFLNKSIFVFIVSILSVSCAARDIEFSVTPSRDRMEVDSVFSKNSAYFTSKGSSQVGIYSRNPYKRTGSICCHKGERTEEFFLKNGEGNDLLMQLKQGEGHSDAVPMLSVFDTEGKLMAGPLNLKNSQSQLIAVSPSKEKFAVLDRGNIIVYSSNLKIIKEYSASKELSDIDAIALSNDANSVLVKNSQSLVYVDLNARKEVNVQSCDIVANQSVTLNAYETEENRFFVVANTGESCVINQGKAEEFKLTNIKDRVIGVYAAGSDLYVLTESSIFVFDQESLYKKGEFNLPAYYAKQFGDSDPYQLPLILKSEFDWHGQKLYLRGHKSTKKFYEIGVIN